MFPGGLLQSLLADITGGVLKGLEARHENVGKEQKSFGAFMILAESPENSRRNNLTQSRTRPMNIMSVACVRLLL